MTSWISFMKKVTISLQSLFQYSKLLIKTKSPMTNGSHIKSKRLCLCNQSEQKIFSQFRWSRKQLNENIKTTLRTYFGTKNHWENHKWINKVNGIR